MAAAKVDLACGWLARQGLFVGPSSGAFAHAATLLAGRGGYASVVIPLCDTGERYGSTGLWEGVANGVATEVVS